MIFQPHLRYDRYSTGLSPAQLQLLSEALRPDMTKGLNVVHFVAGRGAGKSFIGCMALGLSVHHYNQGYPHLWAAPNGPDLEDTFLPRFEQVWPQSEIGWRVNLSKRIIYWPNGTPIYYRGRLATNRNREPFRGPDYLFAIFDEARQDPNDKAWKTLLFAMRGDADRPKTIITTSTPLLGWYCDVVRDGMDPIIYSTSYDNPISDTDAIARAMEDYDERLIEQEVYGKWISLSGSPWENANLADEWPKGNIHPHEWDPSMEYTLCADIGRQSAWLLLQHVPVLDDLGYPEYDKWGKPKILDVAVAEYAPNNMSTDVIVPAINRDFGPPSQIFIGHDVGREDINTSDSSAEVVMARSAGWVGMPIRFPTGIYARKQMQYIAAARCLKSGKEEFRRFCISRNLKSFGNALGELKEIGRHQKHGRGIKQVLTQDNWPDPTKPGFFEKDKRTLGGDALEDMRDAWMYGMIMLHPIRGYKQI